MIPLGALASSYVAPAGSSWTPADLTTLAIWLDADDASTITHSGGLVSQWDDKSGNGRHLTAAGTRQPTTGADTINGLNTLTFITDDGMDWAATPDLGSDITVLAVATPSASAGYIYMEGGASTNHNALISLFSSRAFEAYSNSGRTTLGPVSNTGAHVIGYTRSGASGTGRYDGTAQASLAMRTTDVVQRSVGYYSFGASHYNGIIGELVVCSTVLTGADLTNLEDYLMTKWGIS